MHYLGETFDCEQCEVSMDLSVNSEWLHALVGLGPDDITWWQMIVRGVIIFFFGLVLVRFGGTRAFGKNSAFDIVLGVIMGSVLSRALTANAPLLPSLASTAALVVLHNLLAAAACRWHAIGWFIKGREVQLVRDGEIDQTAMYKGKVTWNELMEAVRSSGSVEDMSEVKDAFLERNGSISVITRS